MIRKRYRPLLLLLCLFALILISVAGVSFGSVKLSLKEVLNGLFDGAGTAGIIVRRLRLPRVLAAILSGAALAASGSLLQSATGNDLTSPGTIGINSGAGAAVMLSLCFMKGTYIYESLFAFLGALAAAFITLGLARSCRGGASRAAVVLAGVAVGSVFSAVISFLSLRFPDALPSYTAFSVGGYAGVYLDELALPSAVISAALLFSLALTPRLNLLVLGDELATSLGVRANALRLISIVTAAALASASVSFAGLIGFVGLIAPHIASRLVGFDERVRLPLSMIIGASLTVLSDLLGRTLFTPTELPSGIILNLIGAPFFLSLLIFGRRGEGK